MRYSVYLEASLVGGNPSEDVSISFNPSNVIESDYLGSRFLVRSSFSSKNQSSSTLSGMRVGWYNTSTFNSSNISDSSLLILGIAQPYVCGASNNMCYQYLEGECFIKMINTPPNTSPMVFNISTLEGNNLASGKFYLNVSFELH